MYDKNMKLYYLFGRLVRPLALLVFFLMNRLFHIRRARIIIQNEQDEALLIRGWTSGNRWELSGGGISKHETPAEAIKREVQEELGINIPASELVYMDTVSYGYEATIFRAVISKDTIVKRNEWEIVETRWFSEVEIPSRVTKITQLALEKLPKT
jgi:mutator protein MutT